MFYNNIHVGPDLLPLAYDSSSVVQTLQNSSFHVWWRIRLEIEITAGVSGFSVNFGVHCTSDSDEKHVQQRIRTVSFYFHDKPDGRP